MNSKKKLIEVALPLEAINRESVREKSIRHGHPSTLHLWWSRKPLATCRAVLFASLVDDPSSHPDKFPTEAKQEQERQRLLDIIGKIITVEKKGKTEQTVKGLVSWDPDNHQEVMTTAQKEKRVKAFKLPPPPLPHPRAGRRRHRAAWAHGLREHAHWRRVLAGGVGGRAEAGQHRRGVADVSFASPPRRTDVGA